MSPRKKPTCPDRRPEWSLIHQLERPLGVSPGILTARRTVWSALRLDGDARVEIELETQAISPSPGQRLQDVRPGAVVVWLAGEELAWKSRVRDRQPNPVEAGARDPRKVFLGLQRSPEADDTCDGR